MSNGTCVEWTNRPTIEENEHACTGIKDVNGTSVHIGDLMLNHMFGDVWEVCDENGCYRLKLLEQFDEERYTTDLDGVGGFEVIGCVKEISQATTIPTTKPIRDRLKSYGHKGETYSDILTRMMDLIDKEEFMDRMYNRLEEKDKFVSIDEV